MRMWMAPPQTMCRAHLLGEHVEIHMFVGTINKGGNVSGYLNGGLLEFDSLQSRHDELVREMTRRGYKHNSPLPEILPRLCLLLLLRVENRKIDVQKNIEELCRRCEKCRELYFKGGDMAREVKIHITKEYLLDHFLLEDPGKHPIYKIANCKPEPEIDGVCITLEITEEAKNV